MEKLLLIVAGMPGKRSQGIDLVGNQLLVRGFLFDCQDRDGQACRPLPVCRLPVNSHFLISIRWESSQYEKVETKY